MSDHSGEMQVYPEDHLFGNSDVFPGKQILLDRGVATRDVSIDRAFQLDPDAYDAAAVDIGSTLTILEGEEVDGVPTTLEIAIAAPDPDSGEYTATYSTGSSSMWNNKTQAAEHALRASGGIRNFLYVTAPGQGGSSNWTPEEEKYVKKTGRFVTPDGAPLPSIAEKQRMLDEAGFVVVRSSSDADGCNLAIAHAVAMEPGQLTHAHLNNAPIANKSGLVTAALDELVNQVDDWRTKRASEDPARLTPDMIRFALAQLPERPEEVPAQSTKFGQARTTHTPGKLAMVAAGVNRGRDDSEMHPTVLDTARLIEVHPEARVVFSIVHRAMAEGEVRSFFIQLRRELGEAYGDPDVSAIYTPGIRRMHKAYPTQRESIRQWAFR